MSSTFCLLKKKLHVGIQNLSSENPRDVHFLWQVFTDFASFGSFSRKKILEIPIILIISNLTFCLHLGNQQIESNGNVVKNKENFGPWAFQNI